MLCPVVLKFLFPMTYKRRVLKPRLDIFTTVHCNGRRKRDIFVWLFLMTVVRSCTGGWNAGRTQLR